MEKKNKNSIKKILIIGLLGISTLSLGISGIGIYKNLEALKEEQKNAENFYKGLLRYSAYIISDKDYNGKVDYEEAYSLGLELKVVKDNEKITETELSNRIKNVPLESIENYINKYSKNKKEK